MKTAVGGDAETIPLLLERGMKMEAVEEEVESHPGPGQAPGIS